MATDARRITAFVICAITYPNKRCQLNDPPFLTKLFDWMRRGGRRKPHLEVFALGLANDCRRGEAERFLLDAILNEFGEAAERVQAVVPEMSVSAQKFLRNAGFLAIRIFRGYYGREDGYLMRRNLRPPLRNGPRAAAASPVGRRRERARVKEHYGGLSASP